MSSKQFLIFVIILGTATGLMVMEGNIPDIASLAKWMRFLIGFVATLLGGLYFWRLSDSAGRRNMPLE